MISQLPLLSVKLQVTVLNEIPLIQLPACLSEPEVLALKETCQHFWQQKHARIVLDLSQTTFIDNSVVDALANSLKSAAEQGFELVLWSVQPQVRAALLLVGLDPFVMIDSETKAINLADTHQLKDRLPTDHPSGGRVKQFIDIVGGLIRQKLQLL